MPTATVTWEAIVVQEPVGAMDAASWRVRLYNNDNEAVLDEKNPELAVHSVTFPVDDGSSSQAAPINYIAGIQAMDHEGRPAGDEVLTNTARIADTIALVTRPRAGVLAIS